MGPEPGRLQPGENRPWPAAARGCQPHSAALGAKGPREALPQAVLALARMPSAAASTCPATVPALPCVSQEGCADRRAPGGLVAAQTGGATGMGSSRGGK